MTAVVPAGLVSAGETDATPGVGGDGRLQLVEIGGVVAAVREVAIAMRNGPLKPGPKPLRERGRTPRRVCVPAGSLPASTNPRRSDSTGSASVSTMARPPIVSSPRVALDEPAPPVPHGFACAVAVVVDPRQPRPVDVRCPSNPSIAGNNVTAAATVTATTAAAPIPRPLMNDRPIASMPSNAMITVRPANTHRPSRRVDRGDHRFFGVEARLESLSVAGDDEQRVVDAHTDADHRRQRRGEALQRIHVRQQTDDGKPDRDTGQRDDDGQHHREHRPERDQQDDDRGEDADPLARQRRPLGLLDELPAETHL